jgi:hypothetical protein
LPPLVSQLFRLFAKALLWLQLPRSGLMGQGQSSYVYDQSVALGLEAPLSLPFATVFGWDPLFPYLDRLYIDSELILGSICGDSEWMYGRL